MKKLVLVFISLLFVTSLYAARASKPDWVRRHPTEKEFYIGIGSAKSTQNNEANDYQLALERARSNLAASISVEIISELEVSSHSITTTHQQSLITEEYKENILQYVTSNLKEVEIVDSWTDKKSGTWVYLRLSKAKYLQQKMQEMAAVSNRVSALLQQAEKSSFAQHLEILFDAWEIVDNSFYSQEIQYFKNNIRYTLIDYIELQLIDLLESGSLTVHYPKGKNWEIGTPLPVHFEFRVDGIISKIQTGRVSFSISHNDKLNMAQFLTDSNGKYAQPLYLEAGSLAHGQQTFLCQLQLEKNQPIIDLLQQKEILPTATFSLNVIYPQMGIVISSSSGAGDLSSSLASILHKKGFPLEFVPYKIGHQNLVATIRYTVMPVMFKNQPIITKAHINIAYEQDGKRLFSYDFQEVRGGGISEENSKLDANSKILNQIENDHAFFDAFMNIY